MLLHDRDPDPHSQRGFLQATTAPPTRALLLRASAAGWSAVVVTLLTPSQEGGAIARSPLYGGPWLEVERDVDPEAAAAALRGLLDRMYRDLDVISEVTVLSPWTPFAESVATAWGAVAAKPVCLRRLGGDGASWPTLDPKRRSEIRRALTDGQPTWTTLGEAQARRFARVYADAMTELDAAERWRHDEDYFMRLAHHAGSRVRLAMVEMAGGGAAALFLVGERRVAYLYAARWGRAPGAASAALWTGAEALSSEGCQELLLGGGVTNADDDPLLRFKRGFASRETPLLVAGRAFDLRRHEAAVAHGETRPLPPGAVIVPG